MSTDLGEAGATTQSRRNDNAFDFLRLLFACMVILSHVPSQQYGRAAAHRELLMTITHHHLTWGDLAVDGFVLISGYLIVQSFERCSGVKNYLFRRVARIYPAFVIAMLFSTWVVGWWGAVSRIGYFSIHHAAWFAIFTAALKSYSPPVFSGYHFANVNGSTWTIQYEFLCYLLVIPTAVCGLFSGHSRLLAVTLTLAILQLPGFPLHSLPNRWGNGSPLINVISGPQAMPRFFLYFLTGACYLKMKDRLFSHPRLLIAATSGLIIYCIYPALEPILLPACFGFILFYFALHAPKCLHNSARYGDFSYGIYLYAWPITMALLLMTNRQIATGPLILFTILASTVFAAISWHLVERPILKWVHTKTR